MDDNKVLLQTTFSYTELEKIALDIMNLGMVLRQDQLNGYCDKSGNDVVQEYLQQFWEIPEKTQPDRGSCSECGEGYDNDEEWLYNTKCAVCGHPIPAHLIIDEPTIMKTKIRIEVLNLTMENWKKIDQITFNGFQIEVEPKELIDLIGFDGGQFLSGKLNEEERIFVDAYYELGRALVKQTDV